MDTRRKNEKKYIVLKKAAKFSGYSSDYIGYLVRKGEIKGKKVYTNVSWQVSLEEIIKYCKKPKNLDIRDFFLLKKKYLSLKEAAKLSGYAPDYIGYLIRKGKIKGKKIYSGATWITTKKAIQRYQEKIELKKRGFSKIVLSSLLFFKKAKRVIGSSWRFVLTTFILLFLISIGPGDFFQKITGALIGIFSEEPKTINLYTTSCNGDPEGILSGSYGASWQNFQNAIGEPQIGPEGAFDSFSEANSAVYKGGSLTLVCQDFRTSAEQTIEIPHPLPEEEVIEETIEEEQITSFEVEEIEAEEQEEVLPEEESEEEQEIIDSEISEEEIDQEMQETEETQEEEQTEEQGAETTEDTITEEGQFEEQEKIVESETQEEIQPEEVPQEEQAQQEQESETSPENITEEVVEEEIEESLIPEVQLDIENSEEEPVSFFEKVKRFFGFSTTKAQQIPTFEELQETQFLSAKIKFSFAIGEREVDFAPLFEESKKPDSEIPLTPEISPVEPVTPSNKDVTGPTSFWKSPFKFLYAFKEKIGRALRDFGRKVLVWVGRIRELFANVLNKLALIVRAEDESDEEDILPTDNKSTETDSEPISEGDANNSLNDLPEEFFEENEELENPPQEESGGEELEQEISELENQTEEIVEDSEDLLEENQQGTCCAERLEGEQINEEIPEQEQIEQESSGIQEEQEEIQEEEQPFQDILLNLDAKIIIWYSLDEDTPADGWQQLDTISDYPLSNALNGGYFSYDAPFLKNWDDVQNLKIKFEGVVGGETVVVSYLDSVWLEAEYQEIVEEDEFELRALKKDWRADEEPIFKLIDKREEEKGLAEKFFSGVTSIFTNQAELETEIKVNLTSPGDKITSLQKGKDFNTETHSPTQIKIFQSQNFRPGLHKLKISFEKNDKTYELEQEFTWGVLAINTNKSIYLSGEQAYLQMAALKDDGHTLCNANLKLEITNPNGEASLPEIQKNADCRPDQYTVGPDYFSYYQIGLAGRYEMKLINLDNNYEITDFFEVRDSVPFEVERIGPTRVYPPAIYKMTLKIKANQDFQGEVTETVPSSFEILNQELRIKNQESEEFVIHNSSLIILEQGDGKKTLSWQNITLPQDDELEIEYAFDAPDISPCLYLLGPLVLGEFKEARSWQIAVDAANMILLWDGGAAPTGWTCISCSEGDPFYQRFAYGSDTYNTQTGASTHDHTADVSTGQPSGGTSSTTKAAGTLNASRYHTHSISDYTVSSESNVPPYRDLKFIKYDSGIPTTIPQGAIAIFDDTEPSGWTRYSAQDTYFIQGEATAGGTGGASTHTHTLSATLGGAIGTCAVAGSHYCLWHNLHTHTVTPFSSPLADHTPPYINVILAKADSDTSIVAGMIAMFDATPTWTVISGSGGALYQKFIVGNSTYGGTGGNATHTHSNTSTFSGSSSQTRCTAYSTACTSSSSTHWHYVYFNNFSSESNLPPYTTVIYAKYEFTISGIACADESEPCTSIWSGCDSSTERISLVINGGTVSTTSCNTSTGAYSFSGETVAVNNPVSVFFNTAGSSTDKGVAVTVAADSTSSIVLNPRKNIVWVKTEGAVSNITNSNLDHCDSASPADCANVPYTVTSSNLTVSSGTKLIIETGKTFAPGGTVATTAASTAANPDGDILISSTAVFTVGTNAVSIGGDWTNSGTFTKSTGQTTTFTATGTGFSITDGGVNFDSLTFNGLGGGWSFVDSTTIDVDLTVTAGTLSGTQDITVNGGDVTGNGDINLTGGTFLLDAAGNFGGNTNWDFYDLTFGNGSGATTTTKTGSGSITVSNALTIAAEQTLEAGDDTWILSGSGTPATPFIINGTFTAQTSIFQYTGGGAQCGGQSGSGNLILLWDGGAAPTGWTCVSCSIDDPFYQRFAYGSDAYGSQGGASTHDHTADVSTSGPSHDDPDLDKTTGTGNAATGHTHSIPGYTVSSESNNPPYRNLKFIKYDSGMPTIIPQGAIAIFDGTLPSGWTRYSSQDNYFIQGEATAGGTGGSSTHTHTLSVTGGLTGGANQTCGSAGSHWCLWSASHTHTVANDTSPSADHTPPYINVILAKADSDTSCIPNGMIAMFDATPGGSWNVISGSGGDLYQKFIQGSATYGGTGGNATHTHANDSWMSGWNETTNCNTEWATACSSDSHNHYHTIYFNNFSSPSHLPLYTTVIYAKAGPTINITPTTYNNLEVVPTIASMIFRLGTAGSQTINTNGYFTAGNGTNAVTVDANNYDPTFNVDGNFTISTNATFIASNSGTFTIAGNFTNSGTFTHSSGTITFDGAVDSTSELTYNAAITFNDFTVSTAGKRIEFDETDQTNIAGTFYIQGTDCTDGRVFLASTTDDNPWDIDVTGSINIDYADIEDSNAITDITSGVDNSTQDNNNNDGWTISAGVCAPGISISGNAYENETATALDACDGSTPMIRLYVGSTLKDAVSCDNDTGAFSFSSVTTPSGGDPMILWIDGATCGTSGHCASTVNRYLGSGDVSSLEVRKSRLMIMSDSGNVTNANLDLYDNGNDSDIIYTVTSNNIELEDGYKLIVNGGVTYAPGGTVTTDPSASAASTDGDIFIESTGVMTVGTNAVSIGGDWINSGTFTKSTGQTTTFTATATSHVITDGGFNFDTLVFNGASGGWSFADSTIIDVDLTMTAGTLSGTNDITVNGGDVTGNGTITLTGGTFLLDTAGNFGGDTAWTFYNLTFGDGVDATTSTKTGTGAITVSNVLTIAANQTLDAGDDTWTLSGTGAVFIKTGTFTANNSTFQYTGDGAVTVTAATYYNLTLSPTITAGRAYTAGGATTVNNNLDINPTAGSDLALTFNLGGTTSITGSTTIQRTSSATATLDTTGSDHSFTTGSLSIQAGGTLTGNASALDSNGDVTIAASGTLTSTSGNFNVGGSWSNSVTGVFTHSSGTVIFDATTTGKTISDGGDPFYDLQFTGANGGWTYTDGASTAPNTTVVNASSGTATFINAKTATVPTVSAGTLNVDWYLGVKVVDAVTLANISNIADGDITISENSGTPQATIWKYGGGWGSPASSKTTSTDVNGENPQPTSNGAILIREYSNTAGSPTYYLYNLHIAWQSTYGEYNYYADYGNNYLTSTANSGANKDAVIGVNWYRSTPGTMNAVGTINEPPTNGSWYCGMLKGLEVTITGTSIAFGTLDTSNNFSATAGTQTQITVTTSATSGYIVTAWENQLMTCSDAGACGSETIQNFTYGTYANPQPWGATDYCKDSSNYCGFGFTSSDTSVESSNRYNGATEYTFFPTDSSVPVRVMDYGGPVSSQSYLVTYRISASLIQRPGPYGATVIYVVTAQY